MRPIDKLIALTPEKRAALFALMPPEAVRKLQWSREFWCRPSQIWKPSKAMITLWCAGRGYGKNFAGAHTVRYVAENPELCGGRKKRNPSDMMNGKGGVIGIAGRTANDVNETILYGPSGLMTISPPWFRPVHNRSAMTLTWPNGVKARLFSGDVPESFRGPNIGFLWCDELPHWKRLAASWEQAMFTLRHGKKPRCIITTTPLGVPTLLDIMFEKDDDGNMIPDADTPDGYRLKPESEVVVIRGASHDNRDHLAKSFLERLDTVHSGTRLGAQEVQGVVLIGNPNSIWKLENFRRCDVAEMPKMDLIVVAVDPAVSNDPSSGSETGIAVMGIAEGQLWLLEDGSGEYTESQWARRSIELFTKWDADAIVGEVNQGGNLVGANVRHHAPKYSRIRFEDVRASKSKTNRARLVSGLWEQLKVVHVGDSRTFLACEHQMTQFDPRKAERKQKTDRMDAVVWAAIWLLGSNDDRAGVAALGNMDNWRELMAKLGRC